ncbi:hypothetical protein NXS98_15770 [Fontisphaera persica]|uniref:hypothetical protein n=1 Tax=Fontisphaera persica TaxID=2974023 RepID=UPI0024C0A357|nr:hypothetical protein [Fontisphaera persica]WCJ59156.1 hypothetical protein NXS98_15770 [Fontisphaera persica]
MTLRRAIAAAAIAQLAGLWAVGWWFREALNTDAVAYLRLAEYYAEGKWSLAINGYWGPLLSWLMAPFFILDFPPWLAARIGMGLSAVFFFVACNQWFLTLPWEEHWKKAAVWTAALVSLPWSVANITPDLLLAGFLACSWAALYHARATDSRRWSLLAGALSGAAYLAKAVALPVACLTAVPWLLSNPLRHRTSPQKKWGLLAAFFVGLAAVMAPWVATLSAHYGQFTLTRAAVINHALAGPPDVERYHPTFRTFHHPHPSRLTSWEDPSEMPYATWRPWASPAYAWHQGKIILKNLALIQLMLTTLMLDWPVLLGYSAWWWRRQRQAQHSGALAPPLQLAAWGLLALMAVYAPNYLRLGDQRYFYPALPLLWVAGAWMAEGFCRLLPEARRWLHPALALSFLIPAGALLCWWLPPKRAAGQIALELAEGLRAAHLRGPTAGSALQPGGRTGLMTAYYLGLQWYGDQPGATVADCLRSGVQLFFVNRSDPLAEALAQHPEFQEVSLPRGEKASLPPWPVAVFQRLHAPRPGASPAP